MTYWLISGFTFRAMTYISAIPNAVPNIFTA